MTEMIVTDCETTAAPENPVLQDSTVPVNQELNAIIHAAQNGDQESALKIRKKLIENPKLFENKAHSASRVHALWIARISGQDLFRRELLFRQIGNLRSRLKNEGPGTAFDELLIDGVLMAYLEILALEDMQIVTPPTDIVTANFQLKAIESATRRFEKAMRLLTETRQLLIKPITETTNRTSVQGPSAAPDFEIPHDSGAFTDRLYLNRITRFMNEDLDALV